MAAFGVDALRREVSPPCCYTFSHPGAGCLPAVHVAGAGHNGTASPGCVHPVCGRSLVRCSCGLMIGLFGGISSPGKTFWLFVGSELQRRERVLGPTLKLEACSVLHGHARVIPALSSPAF